MNAFDELTATGVVGADTYALFLTKARSATWRFPPADGGSHWTEDALSELVHDLFVSKGAALTLTLLDATSQDQLEKLVRTIIDNYLKDQAKSTPRGKLRRRLANILDKDQRFARSDRSSWRMSVSPDVPSRLITDDLLRAADAVRGVTLTELNPSGPTSSANRAALLAVMLGVLTAAGGSVREEDLAKAVEHRFQLATPLGLEPELAGGRWVRTTDSATSIDDADRQVADDLWELFSDRERLAIEYLSTGPVDGLAEHLRCGPKQAAATVRRVRSAILAATTDDRRIAVTHQLIATARGYEFRDEEVTSSRPHDGLDSGPHEQGGDR